MFGLWSPIPVPLRPPLPGAMGLSCSVMVNENQRACRNPQALRINGSEHQNSATELLPRPLRVERSMDDSGCCGKAS